MQKLSHTSMGQGENSGHGARKEHSRRSRKAIARLMEAMESRILMSTTDWLSVPTAELRQPTTNAATQLSLQSFPPAAVTTNGSLQYSTSWVANSYGGYDVMAPDGGALTYNLVQQSSAGVAAGPLAADGTYLMGITNGYSEEGNGLSIYQDGAALSTNDSPGVGGGRGLVFGDSHAPYAFQSMNNHDKDTGMEYYTVQRYTLGGAPANFASGVSAGQNAFGTNTLSGQPNYIYSNPTNGLQPTALGYFYNTSTGTPTLYVSNSQDNSIYMFNAETGTPIATPGVNGIVLNTTSGTQTVTVSDGTHSVTSATITVKPAITTTTLVPTTVTNTPAGTAFSLTVTARKSDGTTDTGYTGMVSFTSTDGQVSAGSGLPSNYTFVSGDAGVHIFTVTLKTAGNQTITATDLTNGLVAVATTPITVTGAATATSFAFTGSPITSVAASNNFTLTLTAKDAYGNAATGYTGTVHFTTTCPTSGLPSDYTFKGSDHGIQAFGMNLKTVGSPYTVTATDTVNGTLTVTTGNITVGATDTSKNLSFTGAPTQTTAGTTFSLTVTALKADGVTPDNTNNHTVHFSSSDSQAQIWNGSAWVGLSSYTPSFTAGVLTLTNGLQLRTAGSQTITATDWTDQGLTLTTNPISVSDKGVVDHLTINTVTLAAAGTSFNATVRAEDQYGNAVVGYTGTVHFASSDGSASLPGITIGGTAHSYTFIAPDKGSRPFVNGSLAISDPYDMAVDGSGYLWVANRTGGLAQYNATTGALTGTTIANLPAGPNCVAWDSHNNRLVVGIEGKVDPNAANHNSYPIQFYNTSGTFLSGYGASIYSTANGALAGQMGNSRLSYIVDIDVDGAGNIYVATHDRLQAGDANVRVLDPTTDTLLYAEICDTHGASATPASYLDSNSVYHDEMYTEDGQFTMNYANATGDQWKWTGMTFDAKYTADIRVNPSVTGGDNNLNTPLVRYINGQKYMYLLGGGTMIEVYVQDANSYIFRPLSIISMAKGDPTGGGSGGAWLNNVMPAGSMWIWTDKNADGIAQANNPNDPNDPNNEFNAYTGPGSTQWNTGVDDAMVDSAGNIFFSVGKAYGDASYGPAIIEMQNTATTGAPLYNWTSNSTSGNIPGVLRTLLPDPLNPSWGTSWDVQWGYSGTGSNEKSNDVQGTVYDRANDMMYLLGGPSDGEGGAGLIMRAYQNWSAIPHDSITGLADLTAVTPAWSISPNWINLNDAQSAMHEITAAGGYVFIESRGASIYAYNGVGAAGGTLAANIFHGTMTTINAFPDNYPPFQAITRANGDIILTTEGFYTEPFYRILAPGNHSPTASFSQDVQTSITSPVTVNFKAMAGDADAGDNANLTYTWQFGDGTFDRTNSPTVTHTYTYNGAFSVDLTVSDGKGGYTDVASTVSVGPATISLSNIAPMAIDGSLTDTDSTGDGAGMADDSTTGGTTPNLGGSSSGATDHKNYCDFFPFDLWANGLTPGAHVSATNLPTLSFVLASLSGTPANADLYAIAMRNEITNGMEDLGSLYYAGPGDTSPSAVMVQQNFLVGVTGSGLTQSPVGTRILINPAAALVLANYINAALDAGNRYIILRLSPQNLAASSSYYSVYTSEGGTNSPRLSVTAAMPSSVRSTSIYTVSNNALGLGTGQYGNSADSGVTFTTIPAKYLGATYIRTDNNDKATSTTSGGTLQFSVNQSTTVYVLYDDALSAHKPAWLTSFTDTGDNIVSSAGTFSVYKNNSDYAAGTINLGANTSDGSSAGHMYSVVLMPSLVSVSSGLVGWWKMDEASGSSVVDSAGAASDNGTVVPGSHTVNGVPVWGTGYLGNTEQFDMNLPGSAGGPSPVNLGQSGTALHFDGTDYASITDNGDLHPANNMAVSLWAANDVWEKPYNNRNGWQSTGYLISSPNFYIQPQLNFTTLANYPGGPGQSFPDGQQMIFAVNTSTGWKTITYMVPGNDPGKAPLSYTNNFNLFQWHQYGMTYTGGTLTAYVDGIAVATVTGGGTLTTTAGNVGIAGNGTTGNYFQGAIDDVRIYNTASVNMQVLGNLGGGVSAVDGMPTAKGTTTALRVTAPTGLFTAAVTVAATSNATEGGANGVFTVTRTGSTANPLTVNYVVNGSAVNGNDYASLPGTVTIPAGQSTATINIAALSDHLAELTDTVDLTLAGGTGYYISSPSQATVTIANNAGDTVDFVDGGNLKGYWRFDENSGTTMYDSAPVTADNGTATSVNAWMPGVIGNALYMNASSSNVITINDSNNNLHSANMSVALWAQSGTATWNKNSALIIGNNNFEILPVMSTKTVTFGIYAGSSFQTISYTPTFDITLWHQYALTYNDTTKVLTAYVDGASVGTLTVSGTRPAVSSAVTLGKLNAAYFKGTLDEVSFYNTAIPAADIATLYNQTAPQVSITGLNGSHGGSYGVANNALQAGVTLYGDASNTFSTIPGKYLGGTLIKTANADAASTASAQLGLTVNTNSIVYVLYDDAITGSHRADYSGGWLSGFTDTGDNITDSSGHTFSVYKKNLSAGTIWLGGNTADGVNGTGLMYDVLVQPLTATNTLSISTVSSATAGTAISSITVTAKNPNGTTATGYRGTVHFTSSDGQAVLPSDYTFVSGDNGVHTFTNAVTLKTAGNQIVLATDTVTGAVTGISGNITVSAAAASQLAITTQPSNSATAGSAFATQPVVKLEDTYGNVITSDSTHTITAVSNGSALLQGTLTVTLVNGVGTFTDLSYNKAETMTIGFSSNAGGVSSATSGNIVVGAAAASQAVITTQPSGAATAGSPFATQPVVKLEDTYGNVVSDSTHTVTAVSNGTAGLQGTTTVTLVNGVATFTNLSYNKAETLTIGFSTNAGSETATSSNIVVSPAAASQLVITQQPSATATVGVAFAQQPIVQMRDAYNNVITSDSTHTVTAARYTGTGALQGTTTVTEVNGVATFTNLSYNTAETMNIRFSSNLGGVSTADSTNVVVSSGIVTVTIAPSANATEGGGSGSFTVTRTGTSGDLVVNYSIGGSAVNGTDDTSLSGTVTILNGSSTATITVAATNDTVAELTETVDLTLTSGTGYTVGSPNYATVNIIDNDSAGFLDNSNLVGYWRFDENSGATLYDSAPVASADNGTLSGTANWGTAGKIGNALYFNSSNSNYVTINDSNGNLHPTSMSAALWAKSYSTNTTWNKTTYLILGNNNFYIQPQLNVKTVIFGVYAGSSWYTVSYTPTFDITLWHQYALTYNDSTKLLTAYVDGASVGTATASGARPTVSSTVTLGKNSANYLKGYIDEVRIYNTAISSGDVSSLYSQAALSVTGISVNGSHGASYSVSSNALQTGVTLYGDAANTFSTIPGKYLGSTLLKTANADAASTGDKQLGFTLNQASIVYVLYDDAISGSHRADATGGWLASGNGFTDTGDNVVDSSGHTFSVYKASVSAGTLWLGGNTLDGVNGTGLMYDLVIQPLL